MYEIGMLKLEQNIPMKKFENVIKSLFYSSKEHCTQQDFNLFSGIA